jgi:hypothetical protein
VIKDGPEENGEKHDGSEKIHQYQYNVLKINVFIPHFVMHLLIDECD